ncbi:MAG: hypothetical protein OEL83_15960 [Desulforhopalus sp.]|nr:hypothetical protein [Desulforhopalus sp.]
MQWQITMCRENAYIEVVTKGIADQESSLEMAQAIAKTMRANRYTKVLIDHRNIEKVSGKVVEIYDRPKLFKLIGVILGIKIAEIINPDHREHFRFLETVCINRGYKFSIFYDKTTALHWLLDKHGANS